MGNVGSQTHNDARLLENTLVHQEKKTVKLVTRKFPVMQLVLCLIILTYFVIIAFLTPALSPLTRLFPLFVIALAIPIGIVQTLSVVNKKTNDYLSGTELIGRKSIEENEADVELSSQTKAIAWMVSYVLLFFLIGPLLAMVVAPLFLMKYFGKMSWLTSLTVTTLTWIIVYLIFVVLVGARLPVGLIFGSIW